VNVIVEEALDEAFGRSSKRWALLHLAVMVGGLVALWLAKRSRRATPEASTALDGSTDPDPATD
jgi:hypothetical protein